MARGGQNRKSAAAKLLAGTYKPAREKARREAAARAPRALNSAVVPVPPAPEHLDEPTRVAWESLRGQVDALGVYRETMQSSLTVLALGLARLQHGALALSSHAALSAVVARQLTAWGLSPTPPSPEGTGPSAPALREPQASRGPGFAPYVFDPGRTH